MIQQPIYPIFLSRVGCPSDCVYCRQEIHADGDRQWTPLRVRKALDDWLPVRGTGEIAFYGGSFTLLPAGLQQDYLDVAADFVGSGRAGGIRFSTHPAGLNEDHLALLRGRPIHTVEVGCQSFSDEVLTLSRRGHLVAQTRQGVRRLHRSGVRVGLQLMPGLPGGDPAEALTSLCEALALQPAFVRIYPTVVLPGTALEGMVRSGVYKPWSLEQTVETCADMLLVSRRAAVPVIRIGLPPLDVPAVAGPWHPALGQLVVSRIWRRALVVALHRSHGEIRVPRACLSDALGHGKSNLADLQGQFGPLTIAGSPTLDRDWFQVGAEQFSWRKILASNWLEEVDHAV